MRRLLGASRSDDHDTGPGALLTIAYPDRVGKRRGHDGRRYLLSSGTGVGLPDGDPMGTSDYLVAARLDGGQREGRIHLAATTTLEELRRVQRDRIRVSDRVEWDTRSQAVVALREERLGSLVLTSQPLHAPGPVALGDAMLTGIRELGAGCLPWTDAARDWQARVLSLRHWRPDDGWPDVSDEALMSRIDQWLRPHLAGIGRADQLRRVDLLKILRQSLDWRLQSRMDEGAPTHVRVPSGSRVRLRYVPEAAPVLAVRIQELFGLRETPRVCWGEVPVMLHLLSPARRPVQVTQDLEGFWDSTYAEVVKELKGRYPKHHWPENPWSAEATSHPKRRTK
jgi:ATP-dependent helicase HrpB